MAAASTGSRRAPSPSRLARAALVVDGSRLFAEAVTPLLEDVGFRVSVATTAIDAFRSIEGLPPDLVLVDMSLPDDEGISLGTRFRAIRPGAVVIGVTTGTDERRARECRRAGFQGCISKDTSVARFMAHVRTALEGQRIRPRSVVANGGGDVRRTGIDLLASQLTNRELEVLAMLVEGASGHEIAQRCQISPNTVRTHVQSVLTKLQVHSRLEAAAFAVRHGLVGFPSSESGAA